MQNISNKTSSKNSSINKHGYMIEYEFSDGNISLIVKLNKVFSSKADAKIFDKKNSFSSVELIRDTLYINSNLHNEKIISINKNQYYFEISNKKMSSVDPTQLSKEEIMNLIYDSQADIERVDWSLEYYWNIWRLVENSSNKKCTFESVAYVIFEIDRLDSFLKEKLRYLNKQ